MALPCDEDIPPLAMEQSPVVLIALSISCNLCNPVFAIAFGRPIASYAVVSVPKASMNKDNLPQSRENEIGCSGQSFIVQSKSITQVVSQPAYNHLWLSVH